jgi:uncharacterized membrane protein
MQMSEQPGDQIGVKPAQWDPTQYSQMMNQIGTPAAAAPGKTGGQRAMGAATGAMSGAMAGSALPIVGTGIGAIIGALAGGLS